jgi:hypothetical protein
LRVTIADKIDNARAIFADHHRLGDKVWKRFNVGKKAQFWYYRKCIKAFDATGYSGPMLEELRQLVKKMRRQVGNTV